MSSTNILRSHRGLSRQYGQLCQVGKILSCGGMIGGALLFPIANEDGIPFRAMTLSIFILSLIAFHGLHIEPFLIYGPYTAPAAFVLLLILVFSGSGKRADLILPWLPLYLVASCLVTAAIYELRIRTTPFQEMDALRSYDSRVGDADGSDRDYDGSWRSAPRAPSEPYHNAPEQFRHFRGPGSQYSLQTGSGDTAITLGNVQGQVRDDWSPQIRCFFNSTNSQQDLDLPGPYNAYPAGDLDSIRLSLEDSARRSDAPLLEGSDQIRRGSVKQSDLWQCN